MNPRRHALTVREHEPVILSTLRWGEPDDRPVVLLHGGGGNAHWWDHIASALAEDHFLVALDFRGHGDSTYPKQLTVGGFNLDLEALCAELGTKRVTLVGHSMGAHVALDHASRHPETRALVLIDPSRGGSARSKRAARLALALKRTYATREEAVDRYRFVPSAEHVAEPLRAAIAAVSTCQEPSGRFGFKFDPRWFGVPPRPRPDPTQVRCPTWVVRGEESALLDRAGAEALVGEIPDARLVEIPGAGHHIPFDQPEALIDALRGALATK